MFVAPYKRCSIKLILLHMEVALDVFKTKYVSKTRLRNQSTSSIAYN